MSECDSSHTEPWAVAVYSQKRLDLSRFWYDDVNIKDISHALSLTCRYNGHCTYHYSVAQHCVYVHNMLKYYERVNDEICHTGLLHDASEAYLQDIIRGCKRQMPCYLNIEGTIQNIIYERYGIYNHAASHDVVKLWDNRVLRSEVQALFPRWEALFPRITEVEPAYVTIEPWTPAYAEERFLGLAQYYFRERGL